MRTLPILALVLLTTGIALGQDAAPTRGDVVMEKYLAHQAAQLSQRVLDGAKTREEWEARRPRLKREFLEMLGLWPLPEKTPLKATVTGTIERDTFVIEKLHFQSRPGLYVTANLYRPKTPPSPPSQGGAKGGKLPAVVLFMGHYNRGRNGHKAFMQDHGMWFASNGYVCIILDTLERGELPGSDHHGLYRHDRWWWLSAGFTMAGLECWNGIRAIDYLVSRPDVDPERITATGLSGGGSQTFYVTAADERVTSAVPASGMVDLEGNVTNRLMAIHCDCQIPYNLHGWEFTTIAALIAPRPLLFVNSHDDVGFPMASNRRIMARLRPLYDLYGKLDRLDEFVSHGPPGAHAYRPDSRVAIFRWINKHNKLGARPVKDADFERIPEEQLRVFPEDKDFPPDAINLKADESFVRLAEVKLPDTAEFDAWKRDLQKKLRDRSFSRFPERIPVSDRVPTPGVFKFKDLAPTDRVQTRTTEIGIEVTLKLHGLDTQAEPREKAVTLVVLNEDDEPGAIPNWVKEFAGDDAVVLLSPRGFGPNRLTRTSPPNFVPRALALLGRTLDDGRVWDIASTARWLERKAGVRVIGRGQAGVLAAYAALFEPAIGSVVVIDPPVSHRNGPHFLNVLRTLDIPDALGLLAPTPLTLVDAKGAAFDRTAEIYRLAGAAKNLHRSGDADEKYPLDVQLKVLANDVKNEKYRTLVLEKMLITDLAAEWQRVATADNPESFLDKHGGKEKVLADPALKRAYERRVQIRADYLELMRAGYRKYKQVAPFDKGIKAEPAGNVIRKTDAALAALSIVLPSSGAETQWPRFRGPSGQGDTNQKSLPIQWNKDGRNIRWRTKLAGAGNSSPIIWGDHVFLTSSSAKGAERFVHCFDRADGRLRWTQQAPVHAPEPGVREKNGYASATPVTDGKRVISFLGSCGLVCHDFDGNLLWHYDAFTVKTTHGAGSSPLFYKDLVILAQDQNQTDSIFLALDKTTGKKVWEEKRPRAMTWSTPVVVHVGDRDEMILAGAETVRGYDPATGKELWSLKGATQEVVPAIVVGKELLYSASGRNGPTLGLRPGGSGDVTQTHLAWRAVRSGPHVPSPAFVNGRLYTANDTGIVTCLDAATGKMIFVERLSDSFSASPIIAGDLLYFAGELGITYVLRAGATLNIVAQNDLGAPILASPAVVDGCIILRTVDELVCVGSTRNEPK